MSHPSERVEALFSEALALSTPEERSAFLDKACGSDRELRQCVERLLRAHEEAGSFLQRSGVETAGLASTLPVPGARVRYLGDYEILEEVARGGMGIVYRAQQISLKRQVALKMILDGHLASPDEVQRFKAEAETAGNLDHPNIVPIYEVGAYENQHYYSMKWIAGPSVASQVRDLLQQPGKTAGLLAMVARAVYHAHERGILHRDLKPANILLDEQGNPQITDFGLAKSLREAIGNEALTRSGAILGTPDYMAPEQARGEKGLTLAVDIYALGAILYECLTGQPPFRNDNPLDTLLQVRNEEPIPPRRLNPAVPRDLETICLKCLGKDPRQRYHSAAELADDLDRFRQGMPIRARRVGTMERIRKWIRRRPAVAALAACMLLLAFLALGMVLRQWRVAVEMRQAAQRLRAQEAQREREAAQAREEAERRLQQVQTLEYIRNLTEAQRAFEEKKALRAADLLKDCPEKLRGWEWHYLHRQSQFELPSLRGHKEGTVRVWDASTGKELRTLEGPAGAARGPGKAGN
jgi:hypothetical protein